MATPSGAMALPSVLLALYSPPPSTPSPIPSIPSKKRPLLDSEMPEVSVDKKIQTVSMKIFEEQRALKIALIPSIIAARLQTMGDLDHSSSGKLFELASEDFYKDPDQAPEKSFKTAATNGCLRLLALHLAEGIEIDRVSPENPKTALVLALDHGHLDAVFLLKKNGAKDKPSSSSLIKAIQEKDLEGVKRLSQNPQLLNDADEEGRTPLIAAVLEENLEMVTSLLQARVYVNGAFEKGNKDFLLKRGITALVLASGLSNRAIVEALLNAGASLRGGTKKSALYFAIKNTQVDNFKLMIAKIESLEKEGKFSLADEDPSLLFALKVGKMPIAELLAQKKIGIHYNQEGETPLIWAVLNQNFPLVQLIAKEMIKKIEPSLDHTYVKNKGIESMFEGHTACKFAEVFNEERIANFLFQCGARNYHGETLVTDAVRKRNLPLLESVLKQISENSYLVNKINSEKKTPLLLAVAQEDKESVKRLLSAGANVDFPYAVPLILAAIKAVKNFDMEIPLLLIAHKKRDFLPPCGAFESLEIAAENHFFSICDALIKHEGTISYDLANKALLGAIKVDNSRFISEEGLKNKIRTVKSLFDAGANKNLQNYEGETLLILAVKQNDQESVKFLISCKVFLDAHTFSGKSALKISQECGFSHIEKILIEAGVKDRLGENVLMRATKKNEIKVIQEQIASKVDLNVQNKKGQTALMLAIARKRVESAKLLIEVGTDLNIQDAWGRTALMYAATADLSEVFDLLVKHKANLKIKENFGNTLLHLAVRDNLEVLVEKIISLEIDLEAKNHWAETVLDIAKHKKFEKLTKLLIEKGAKEQPHLIVAAARGDLKTVREYIEKGTDLNAGMYRQEIKTPLYAAALHQHLECFIALVDAGAEISIHSKKADTYASLFLKELNATNDPKKEILEKFIRHFFQPFCEPLIEYLGKSSRTLLDIFEKPSKLEKKWMHAFVHQIPLESQHHLLKIPFLINSPEMELILFSEVLYGDCLAFAQEMLQKEFPGCQFRIHCLREWRLRMNFQGQDGTHYVSTAQHSSHPNQFLKVFRKINFSTPSLPTYVGVETLKHQDGTFFTKEILERQLEKGISFIDLNIQKLNCFHTLHSPSYESLFNQMIVLFEEYRLDSHKKTSLCIELAVAAGHSVDRFVNQWFYTHRTVFRSEMIGRVLDHALGNFRFEILNRLVCNYSNDAMGLIPSEHLFQVRSLYLDALSAKYKIPGVGYKAPLNGELFDLLDWKAEECERDFLLCYHPTAIVDYIQELILNPLETSLTFSRVFEWIQQDISNNWRRYRNPKDFEGMDDESFKKSVRSYIEQESLVVGKQEFKRTAIVQMLKAFNIFT